MLQLYILAKDRPEELRSALNSAINQDYKDIEIIVSDNSETKQVSKMMRSDFSNIRYINRLILLSPFGHIKQVIDEATEEFMMMFHDDDILSETHVSNMISKLHKNPDVVGVASNGIFFGDSFLKNRMIMQIKSELLIKTPVQLFEFYLGLYSGSQAPLPGYIYRTSILKEVNKKYLIKCGKQSDVQLLAEVLNYGQILWLPTPTLYYRLHSSQESSQEKIYDRARILHLMSTLGIDLNSKSVLFYKFMYLHRWWKGRGNSTLRIPRGLKERVVAKFLVLTFINLSFSNKFFLVKIFKMILFGFLKAMDRVKKLYF